MHKVNKTKLIRGILSRFIFEITQRTFEINIKICSVYLILNLSSETHFVFRWSYVGTFSHNWLIEKSDR
jgi:hypothetical protein